MCDLHVPVRPGGDVAFANAALKLLIERGHVDQAFIDAHTDGWDRPRRRPRAPGPRRPPRRRRPHPRARRGLRRPLRRGAVRHPRLVDGHHPAPRGGRHGAVDRRTWRLARGNVGRDGAGLMPIRGHSGVQGGAEMGAYSTALPGGPPGRRGQRGRRSARALGLRRAQPSGADRARDDRRRGPAATSTCCGPPAATSSTSSPIPTRVQAALGNVPLRIHQDIVLSSQMLVDGDDVILLPVATRYEQEGGGTETTTERRIIFSPEIPRQVGEARSEWRLFADVARPGPARTGRRVRLARRTAPCGRRSPPSYPLTGASRTWRRPATPCSTAGATYAPAAGSRRRTAGPASPPSNRPRSTSPPGMFSVSTRRGKQFNSMVHGADRPAHRRRPGRRVHRPRRRRPARRGRGRRGGPAVRRRPVRGPGQARPASGAAPCRCTFPRATC